MSIAKPGRGIDCHAHVFSMQGPFIANARYRPGHAATLDAWRAQWDLAGITHGVIVQPSFFGTDNGEMLEAVARAPDRLRGVAVVAPDIADHALARLAAGGVRAIRLNLAGRADHSTFANAAWTALFARVAALGWHVEMHVDAGRMPELLRALSRSRVDVVLDHFGTPGHDAGETIEAARALSRHRRVWVKLSAPYRLPEHDPAALAARWIEALGVECMVWGSDWPWTRHEEGRDYARLRSALDDWIGEERAGAVLWDNAARLYRFD